MLDDGVHWLRLLKLEEQLLHGLDGVVTAQVHGHLFNLGWETEHGAAFPARGRPREAVGGSDERDPFVVMRAPLPGAGLPSRSGCGTQASGLQLSLFTRTPDSTAWLKRFPSLMAMFAEVTLGAETTSIQTKNLPSKVLS